MGKPGKKRWSWDRLRALPGLRRVNPQLERLLQGSLILTVVLVLVFTTFGVAGAVIVGRAYDQPMVSVLVLALAGWFAL